MPSEMPDPPSNIDRCSGYGGSIANSRPASRLEGFLSPPRSQAAGASGLT